MRHIDMKTFQRLAAGMRRPFHDKYFAMYSSIYGGITTDPVLMLLPIDDHMVHRGDGIFEVFKCVNGNLYNLAAHMARLRRAATALSFKLPGGIRGIGRKVIETVRAGGHPDCCVHLYVSRGPGGFSVNPHECARPQLYIVVTNLSKPFMDLHPGGAVVRTSSVVSKPAFYAGVKSCNYLPNVLMKKEAVDLGVDFVVSFDDRGCLAEGPTENIGIVTANKELLFPTLDCILAGTTMLRVLELAQKLVRTGELRKAGLAHIPRKEVIRAPEMLIVGTTPNVAMVRKFDGKPIGNGKPGPIFRKLAALLRDDIRTNRKMLTPVFRP
jgi:branched-subunit amino acid aminotransferase/4-amino-4-deoxychorismate lyase